MFIYVCIGVKFLFINMWSIIFYLKIKRNGIFLKSFSYMVNYINFLFEYYVFFDSGKKLSVEFVMFFNMFVILGFNYALNLF